MKVAAQNTIDDLKKTLLPSQENIVAELENQIHQLKTESDVWKAKYDYLCEQFKLAQQQRYAHSTEAHVLQDDMFDEADLTENEEAAEEKSVTIAAHHRSQHPKRQSLPENFPREVITYDISDEEKQCDCCGQLKQRFGETVTEQLDVIPPQFKVLKHVRPKYACKHCTDGVSIAPMPILFLPKSIAAPGLVAYTITNKYIDHVPLYRQEQIWDRYGVPIPRNTSCGWVMSAASQCEPLITVMKDDILASGYIQADETTVQVLKEPERKNERKSYMWIYRGNAPNKISVIFDYQETRAGAHAREFLSSFNGYLQTDGYKGYDWVDSDKNIIHLGCMAHARRPFAQLVKLAKQSGKAHQAVAFIQKLYRIEDNIRGLSPDARKAIREKEAIPILDKLKAWLNKSSQNTPLKSKLGEGIAYMLKRWQLLTNYLLDGRLEIDNNWVENSIRPFAIGRKNWLFAGSPRGAKAGATLYSLIMTCKANDIDPFRYLNYIFNHIPQCNTPDDYRALLPYNISPEKLIK